MPRSSRPRLPIFAFIASLCLACGARSPLETAEREERPEEEPDLPIEPPRFDCRVTEETRPMLAAHVQGAIHWVYPDRTSCEVARFDVPEGFDIGRADILARRDGVAAFALVIPKDGDRSRAFVDAMVLDPNGEIRARASVPFATNGVGQDLGVVGRQDGLFVFHFNDTEIGKVLVVDGDDMRVFDAMVAARRDPDPHGHVMVLDVGGAGSADFHFFDTRSGLTSPSRFIGDPTMKTASSPLLLADGMLYLAHAPSRWVYEDASGTSEHPIDVSLVSPDPAIPAWQTSGDRALFMLGATTPENARYLTVDVATESFRELVLSAPDGYALPAAYWNPPAIDASGRIVAAMSTAHDLRLFASSDGRAWQPLGQPLGLDTYFDLLVAGRTIVVIGRGGGSTTTPGTLPSWSMQLVGPDAVGIELIHWEPGDAESPLDAEATELSADGACFAYFRNGTLHVAEVSGYRTDDIGLRGGLHDRVNASWIPIASP